MVQSRTDITTEPRWPWVIFGDGYMGQMVSIVPSKNLSGIEVYKVRLLPTNELAKRHNIIVENLDDNLTVYVEYPIEMMKQLSADPAFSVWFCFLNFKGHECPATKILKGFDDANKTIALLKIIDMLKGENAYLREKLIKATTNIREYINDEIMGVASEMSNQILAKQPQQNVGPVRQ